MASLQETSEHIADALGVSRPWLANLTAVLRRGGLLQRPALRSRGERLVVANASCRDAATMLFAALVLAARPPSMPGGGHLSRDKLAARLRKPMTLAGVSFDRGIGRQRAVRWTPAAALAEDAPAALRQLVAIVGKAHPVDLLLAPALRIAGEGSSTSVLSVSVRFEAGVLLFDAAIDIETVAVADGDEPWLRDTARLLWADREGWERCGDMLASYWAPPSGFFDWCGFETSARISRETIERVGRMIAPLSGEDIEIADAIAAPDQHQAAIEGVADCILQRSSGSAGSQPAVA